jgi:polyferredoxin
MSTIMVSRGVRDPLERIKFLILFQIPWNIPQVLDFGSIPGWIVHLSFRVYSMMFTTTVLGLVLAGIFKPRTWCMICPVNTISDLALSRMKTKDNIEIKRKGVV